MDCSEETFDYIIVGGGLAGCTLASLLSRSESSPSVLLIEAGLDASSHPLTQAPLACFAAHRSDIDWNYQTVPQPYLDNRPVYNAAGKALGGGTAVNYGTWTRGSRLDYDRWGDLVGDRRWSYDGLLPYFEKIDKGHISSIAVSKSSPDRRHPLRERMLNAWLDLGLEHVTTANTGNPVGVAELVENWRHGKRQIASSVFDLSRVKVITGTIVQKVILHSRPGKLFAKGVCLEDGRHLMAGKEVVLSAGAYRTPQLLLLSGIGPAEDLRKAGVPVQLDLPGVGRNFHDHLRVGMAFRLRNSSVKAGACGPWSDPAYQMGLPADWVVTENVPTSVLTDAVQKDAIAGQAQDLQQYASSLLDPQAAHLETLVIYVPAGPRFTRNHSSLEGKHFGAAIGIMSPTSRGKISISSLSAADPPVIDPHYNETEVDRTLMRYGVRRLLKLVANSLADIVESEDPPPPFEALTDTSSDAAIDARVRSEGQTFFHPAGTASMGTVVDSELRVIGVDGLRVVDASVIPVPIGAHLQVATYVIAAQAADMIIQGN